MSASLLDLMLPDGWEYLLYSIVQGCVAVGCAYLLCGSSRYVGLCLCVFMFHELKV